jgi:AraC-like DNA-binding protein
MTQHTFSGAVNRMWLPRASLATCIRTVLARSTLGVVLSDEQRLSYFPASPLCGISWLFEGEGELLPFSTRPERNAQPLQDFPPVWLHGPSTLPRVTRSPGPAHGMMLLLMPDALHKLTGIELQHLVDRFVEVDKVLPASWITMCENVLTQSDDDARVEVIQNFLEPLWREVRPVLPLQLHRYQDWAHALAMRAATSTPGRSLRQVERRIKQWAGLPMRELRGFGRAEQAFFQTLEAAEVRGKPHWAEMAEAGGYADQSHLCREVRRITGFSPDDLYRRIAQDECFWSYRLWQ